MKTFREILEDEELAELEKLRPIVDEPQGDSHPLLFGIDFSNLCPCCQAVAATRQCPECGIHLCNVCKCPDCDRDDSWYDHLDTNQ